MHFITKPNFLDRNYEQNLSNEYFSLPEFGERKEVVNSFLLIIYCSEDNPEPWVAKLLFLFHVKQITKTYSRKWLFAQYMEATPPTDDVDTSLYFVLLGWEMGYYVLHGTNKNRDIISTLTVQVVGPKKDNISGSKTNSVKVSDFFGIFPFSNFDGPLYLVLSYLYILSLSDDLPWKYLRLFIARFYTYPTTAGIVKLYFEV